MIVVVDGKAGQVSMSEPENLRGLSVQLRACTDHAAVLLGTLGRLDGAHVWLDIDALRALSPMADDPEWVTGFNGVMKFAESQGWIDDTGTRVRAHLADPA
ncbi:MAG TPA: hypothetical protein VMZ00_16825 [Sporichthya sp.]|nr:hypothetical protein [Sporichthya sp.]